MLPKIVRDDTLDPAYFARKPRPIDGGGSQDLEELIRRVTELEGCCEEVQPELETLRQAIEILNGTDDGSVIKTVGDAIDEVIDSAPETFDTFKEVADWIEANTTTINNIEVIVNQLNKMKAISESEIDQLFN